MRRRASGELASDAGWTGRTLPRRSRAWPPVRSGKSATGSSASARISLKWRHSKRPATRSWRLTLDEQREQLFKDSPSLRRFAADALPEAFVNGRRAEEREAGPLKLPHDVCPWSLDEVLAIDFFPHRLRARVPPQGS